jgi:hypothetical protein
MVNRLYQIISRGKYDKGRENMVGSSGCISGRTRDVERSTYLWPPRLDRQKKEMS